jgi:branched-chain amino acid transport system permease protein
MQVWKVGELANRTGITVRTLHHYDEIGLLTPSERSRSGYRLYTEPDIVRLQQILSLRHLGFSLEGLGVSVPLPRLAAGVLATVSMVGLYLFLQRTMTGRSIRAMAQNRDAAAMVGIRVERLDALVFAIGTGMAAIGGVALAMAFALAPQQHVRWLAWAFLVVVLGGLGNVRNTAVAALLLGFVEAFAGALLPFHYVYVIVYAALAAALLFRSEGLMGTRARTI